MCRWLAILLLGGLALAQDPTGVPKASVEASPADLPRGPAGVAADLHDLLPAASPLPSGTIARVGGTIREMNAVLDRLTIEPFGGGEMKVEFDARTAIYRGPDKVTSRELKSGARISIDTVVVDGSTVFARSIHLLTPSATGESHGEVVAYDSVKNEMSVRDPMYPRPVKVKLASYTTVLRNKVAVPRQGLQAGSLVAVKFVANGDGQIFAHEVSILATPGKTFTFLGLVSHLDLHLGLLVVMDPNTRTSYDISFNPAVTPIPSSLQEGSKVTVSATFEGDRYLARTVATVP